eukprot:scpid85853/ scgid9302/ 
MTNKGLCGSGSLGFILRNCQPEDGKIHDHGDTVYVQPASDPTTIHVRPGGNLYKKPFIFTSPCDVSFKAISLLYFGTCSVSVSYGSDNNIKFLQTLPFPASQGHHWNTGLERLTVPVTKTLQEYMTGIKRRQLMISVSPRKARCEIYPVEHIALARGLTIIAQVIQPTAVTSPPPNHPVTRSASSLSTQEMTVFTAPSPVTNTSFVESTSTTHSAASVTVQTTLLKNSSSAEGTSVTHNKTSTPSTTLVEQLEVGSDGFSLVTTIVVPLVVLSVLLSVFILLLLVRSGIFLSGSSHPWIIAIRKSTVPQNRPDPINQFYENHNGSDGADRGPTAELTDPGLYSAVGPGYSHPTNRPKTPPDIAAALYDSCTENETYTYATRDGAAPTCYVNTETKQKDSGEPYASV